MHKDAEYDKNSITLVKNLHVKAGQLVDIDLEDIDGAYGSFNGNYGYESWFTGSLIYAD